MIGSDIDECSSPRLNDCSQNCVNNLGSFTCSCEAGFKANGTKCEGWYTVITRTRNVKCSVPLPMRTHLNVCKSV